MTLFHCLDLSPLVLSAISGLTAQQVNRPVPAATEPLPPLTTYSERERELGDVARWAAERYRGRLGTTARGRAVLNAVIGYLAD